MPLRADTQRKRTSLTSQRQLKDHKVKMKLPIAIAVLVLVLVANTEARNEDEDRLKQGILDLANGVVSTANDIRLYAMATLDDVSQQKLVVSARNWLTDKFLKMREMLEEAFQVE
ncbi:hypothetical protein COCON_G00003470 [Conger conger]|uniref:Uncharacterized protein n=1 Tax=Conger conger TaxID=82655 RepID=A0A9Q1E131_CONCO|nr:hypothetical protein COCON_G00003470 [Conger conger]